MHDTQVAELSVIGMNGCEDFVGQVDAYLREWRRHSGDDTFLVSAECPRFGTGEGKAMIHESMRGHDVYIICDIFNYGVTYKMRGMTVPMSPDEHFADLKRIIAAIAGKARRLTVIMPMLYEGRQHKRSSRESLDCAMMLQELQALGVSNILTIDAHDPRVQNAIPLVGFDDIRPAYQMLKALVRNVPDILLDKDHAMMISPDEGAMGRCMYYSSVLGLDIGMFYKRRDYSRVVGGRNPIVAHEYLGSDLAGKDAIIVDDMISSGESMIDVAQKVKELGAKRIFVFASFGLFTDGYDKFDKAYADGTIARVFTTNTVYREPTLFEKPWYTEVNMCKYTAYLIDTMNHDGSISELLNPVKRINALMARHLKEMESREGHQMKMQFRAE